MSGHHKWSEIEHKRDLRASPSDLGDGWAVTVDAAGTDSDAQLEDLVVELMELLHPYGGAVSCTSDDRRYSATFSVREPGMDAAAAASFGCTLLRELAGRAGVPEWPIVRVDAMTFAEQDRITASQ